MSENAKRKVDGQEIKIGTCEDMYYIRFEDRFKVTPVGASLDPHTCMNLRWRMPIPSEDGILPGDYDSHKVCNSEYFANFTIDSSAQKLKSLAEDAGIVSLSNSAMGLEVRVKCHHGIKLPEDSGDATYFFNGKREVLYLSALKNTETELRICVSCKVCDEMWSFTYSEIAPTIKNPKMRRRLFQQCSEYWTSRHAENCPYELWQLNAHDDYIELKSTANKWEVKQDGIVVFAGDFSDALSEYDKLAGAIM